MHACGGQRDGHRGRWSSGGLPSLHCMIKILVEVLINLH